MRSVGPKALALIVTNHVFFFNKVVRFVEKVKHKLFHRRGRSDEADGTLFQVEVVVWQKTCNLYWTCLSAWVWRLFFKFVPSAKVTNFLIKILFSVVTKKLQIYKSRFWKFLFQWTILYFNFEEFQRMRLPISDDLRVIFITNVKGSFKLVQILQCTVAFLKRDRNFCISGLTQSTAFSANQL